MKADQKTVLRQLKTVRGQVEGIIRMVEENRYCIDISNQIMASREILSKVNRLILQAHIEGCIMEAMSCGNEEDMVKKMEEMASVMQKLAK